ncbi:EAA4-like protein [Mya arenaria]|uniref:Amino acid transporter n=1 Tax=Mya arenaria TaxID=6604 RepID=A0ABY7G2S8_MYAAR|nr:EAA4-like protein [Mya arenaria]
MIEMKGTNICCSGTFGRCLKREALLLITLVAVGLGFGIGFAVRTVGPSDTALMWMGTASLDAKQNGKITIVSFIYIFVTNMIATILGILGWLVFQPGKGGVGLTSNKKVEENKIETHDIFADLIRNIFPSNLFEATFQQDQTNYQKEMNTVSPDSNTTVVTITNQLGKTGGANLLVSSLAIPSVPSASIVTIVMLLDSLSIPGEATALLFGLEFLLDRLRSTSSVSSNTICAAVTAHFCEVPRNSSANNIEIIISVEEKENMIDRSEESTVAKL